MSSVCSSLFTSDTLDVALVKTEELETQVKRLTLRQVSRWCGSDEDLKGLKQLKRKWTYDYLHF